MKLIKRDEKALIEGWYGFILIKNDPGRSDYKLDIFGRRGLIAGAGPYRKMVHSSQHKA